MTGRGILFMHFEAIARFTVTQTIGAMYGSFREPVTFGVKTDIAGLLTSMVSAGWCNFCSKIDRRMANLRTRSDSLSCSNDHHVDRGTAF